jgi:hypothetical protein
MFIVLVSFCSAEYKKTIMDKVDCTGDLRVMVYNNPACKIRGCSLASNLWTCNCATLKTLELYSNEETVCSITIEYYYDKSKIVFPFTTTFGKVNTTQTAENVTEITNTIDTTNLGKSLLYLFGAIVVIGFIILLVIRYIMKLTKDEEEKERQRDRRD